MAPDKDVSGPAAATPPAGTEAAITAAFKVAGAWQSVLRALFAMPVLGRHLDLFSCFLTASCATLGSGAFAAAGIRDCARPTQLLKLYEFEGCPFCRVVREAISVLDLDVLILPCPRTTFRTHGASEGRYRSEAKKLGGKAQFPLLVDASAGGETPLVMYGSRDIVNHLWEEYGAKASRPWTYRLCDNKLGLMARIFAGVWFRSLPEQGILRIPSCFDVVRMQPLELAGYEASPSSKQARELLCCLELPYVLRTVALGDTDKRKTSGELPRLRDPNAGVTLFGADDILRHLAEKYKAGDFNIEEASLANYTFKKKD